MSRMKRFLVVSLIVLLSIPLASAIAVAGAVAHSGLVKVEVEDRSADGVDLFIPVLTHVFGEAQLDGCAALVSAYRLDNQLYGLPPNRDLLFQRLCKEAIHELGHTYNLLHCHNQTCVMMSSTYVEDIDLKSHQFCDRCLKSLRNTQTLSNRSGPR